MDKNYRPRPKVDSNDAHPVATGVGAAGAATDAVAGQKVAEKVNPK
jgi:hypothetical protein